MLGVPQLDPDTVPGGQPHHDVQPQAQRLVDGLGGRGGLDVAEPLVELGHPLRGHPDALVLDREHDLAALQQPAGQLDMGLRRGERGGVLQKFGDQVAEVVRGEPGDLGVRRQRLDDHPLVALDLADRGAQHVQQRHRPLVVGAVLLRTRQDEEVLAVAAHLRGEVVQLEEGFQPLGVLLALLQRLDDAELALHEAQGAQREVDEPAVYPVVQGRQPLGEIGDLLLERLALLLEHLALGDQPLPATDQPLALALQFGGAPRQLADLGVQRIDGPHGGGEFIVAALVAEGLLVCGVGGQPFGAEPQRGERLGQRAGRPDAGADGQQQAQRLQTDAQLQLRHRVVAQRAEPLDIGGGHGRFDAPHQPDTGGEGGLHPRAAEPQIGRVQPGLVGQPGQIALRGGDVGAVDGAVVAVAGALARGLLEVAQGALFTGVGHLGEGGQPGLAAARGEPGEQQGAGAGGLFGGAAQRGQRAQVGVGGVRPGGQSAGDVVTDRAERLEGLGVGAVDPIGRFGPGQRLLADLREGGQQLGGGGVDGGVTRGVLGLGAQLADLLVHPGALGPGDRGRLAPGAGPCAAGFGGTAAAHGGVGGHPVAFVGQGVCQGDGADVQLRQIDQLLTAGGVVGRRRQAGGTGAEDRDGHDGHRPDEPVAHPRRTAPRATVTGHALSLTRSRVRARSRDRTGR